MKKKIVFILLSIAVILLLCYTIKTNRNSLISTPDVWPEKGDTIAIIDGREYQYDTEYLYKLTDYEFSKNYKDTVSYEPSNAGTPSGMTLRSASKKTETFQEQAVFYELIFLEAIHSVHITEREVSQEKKIRRMEGLFLPLNLTPIYWHNMRSYMGKYLYINKYLDTVVSEYKPNYIPLYEDLKEKYKVEMAE